MTMPRSRIMETVNFSNNFSRIFQQTSPHPTTTNMFGIDIVNGYYSNPNLISKSFHLTPTSFEIVLKLLQEMNLQKTGIYKIDGMFLKDGAPVLANPIKHLYNLSIKLSKFTEQCKIALLKQLFKKGPKPVAKNYRPISLLPLVSKVFENVVQNQTQTYLDRSNIL